MQYEDAQYRNVQYEDDPYEGARYEDAYDAALPGGPRGKKPKKARGPKKAGKAKKRAETGGPGPKLYFGAAAVLAMFVLLGAAAVVVIRDWNGPDEGQAANARIGTPAGNGPSPVSYSSSPSASAYAGITSRRADPRPLTIGEAFPPEAASLAVPGGKTRLKLRAKRLDGDCAAAVWGRSVGAELGRGGCTQAARGIYSDTRRGYALAVAVFNLNASADADRFVDGLEHTIGAGFVLPLEAPGPLDDFGRGFGMARGLAMGHFAVVSWAQRLDGKGDETDETLLSLLIEGGKSPAVLGRAARASDYGPA
ncbi:hypothetical protein [Actinomadura chokoriensis]|uniref:Uncharacterized protein n=1 Tax=Actinomadura chokoriensis TaxID=454156 RepID=A0ABV4QZ86_9ACTN